MECSVIPLQTTESAAVARGDNWALSSNVAGWTTRAIDDRHLICWTCLFLIEFDTFNTHLTAFLTLEMSQFSPPLSVSVTYFYSPVFLHIAEFACYFRRCYECYFLCVSSLFCNPTRECHINKLENFQINHELKIKLNFLSVNHHQHQKLAQKNFHWTFFSIKSEWQKKFNLCGGTWKKKFVAIRYLSTCH